MWCLLHVKGFCDHSNGRATQSFSLCACLHADTAVRERAAQLLGRVTQALSALQFETVLELTCTEQWSIVLSLAGPYVKIVSWGSTLIELRYLLLFMLCMVQQSRMVDG